MPIFWTTPKSVKLAKVVAIVITIIFLILPIVNWIFDLAPIEAHKWAISIGMIIGAVLELVLITIIILECKFLIFISLVILAINIAAFTLCANLSVLKFAISSMTTLKAKLGIDNEDEALDRSIVMELIAIAVLILLLVRYYAVLTVYRWTKLPRVAAGPRITVHNIK